MGTGMVTVCGLTDRQELLTYSYRAKLSEEDISTILDIGAGLGNGVVWYEAYISIIADEAIRKAMSQKERAQALLLLLMVVDWEEMVDNGKK